MSDAVLKLVVPCWEQRCHNECPFRRICPAAWSVPHPLADLELVKHGFLVAEISPDMNRGKGLTSKPPILPQELLPGHLGEHQMSLALKFVLVALGLVVPAGFVFSSTVPRTISPRWSRIRASSIWIT
jgi:hypothetical protein